MLCYIARIFKGIMMNIRQARHILVAMTSDFVPPIRPVKNNSGSKDQPAHQKNVCALRVSLIFTC